jgi:predicted amidohydrolase YtcJ
MSGAFLIRNALVEGRICDVRIESGTIAEIGEDLRASGPTLDARRGELLPGLIDHHIHLLATAARANSLQVDESTDFVAALRERDRSLPAGEHLRVVGYHESFFGALTATRLDELVPQRPARVQYRTGSLWVLNTQALNLVLEDERPPDCVERNAAGKFTGRIWRGDDWLRSRLRTAPPSLAPLGQLLAKRGITHLTDASASTQGDTVTLFEAAMNNGDLPQHLMLMSAHPLRRAAGARWHMGPVKILLDDHALPPLEDVTATISAARKQQRRVAIHCVTAAELALALAAFSDAGSFAGDRIEHGSIVTPEAITEIRRLGLCVVTQPGFIAERGDTYLKDVEPRDLPHLYRCASLIAAGIPTGGSTDAPYTGPDPWAAIAAAISRKTKSGAVIGADERLSPHRALEMFLGDFASPGGPPRRVVLGAPADLMLLRDRLEAVAADDFAEPVAATWIGGQCVHGEQNLG